MSKIPTKTRTGVVFRPGNYPDKGIPVVTEADIEAIVKASTDAVEFDSEHGPSLFDGLLGTARNFRVGHDGGQKVVFADWDEPEPLAQLLGDAARTVSSAFADWNTRKITKIALAKFPRITDAQFSSAIAGAYASFSEGKTVQPLAVNFAFYSTEERDVIPLEDFGDPDNKLFPARTQDEANESMRQLVHADDPTTVKANLIAICDRKKFKINGYPYARPGVSVDIPATGSDYYFSTSPVYKGAGQLYNNHETQQETNHMENGNETATEPNVLQKMAAFFGLTPEQSAKFETTFNTKTPREIELEAENALLVAQVAASAGTNFSAQKGARDTQAATAAQKLLDDKRILPHQIEAVKADFSRALEDDAKNPLTVKFSVTDAQGVAKDVQATRFQSLHAAYSELPPHRLETEQVREMAPETVALFSREATRQANAPAGNNDLDAVAYQQMTGKPLKTS